MSPRDAVLALLSDRGELQSCAIVAALGEQFTMRQVDGALASLRRAGKIETLPRIKKVRPYPLWRIKEAS